jgi:CBS domain-containing protein
MAEGLNYCPYCGASTKKTSREVYTVSSDDLVKKVKELIHEGNITKIIVKNEKDETLLEIPATVGVIGAILLPWMAALGVIAAMVTRCKIIVERREE